MFLRHKSIINCVIPTSLQPMNDLVSSILSQQQQSSNQQLSGYLSGQAAPQTPSSIPDIILTGSSSTFSFLSRHRPPIIQFISDADTGFSDGAMGMCSSTFDGDGGGGGGGVGMGSVGLVQEMSAANFDLGKLDDGLFKLLTEGCGGGMDQQIADSMTEEHLKSS
jgi:hypothetical protein